MMSEIWAAPPEPPAGWPPCEWCGRVLGNPQYFVVRADGYWAVLCLTCITAGDSGGGGVTCQNCGRSLWRRDARIVTVKRPFRKRGGRRCQYQCQDGCLADPGRP
jgi:hypothetical protein